MSWFSLDKVNEIRDKVKSSLPPVPVDNSLLSKLTLTTPELTAERERIEQEERHKEEVRDYLAGILPWETRDEEREILVEDCREAILALSGRNGTFTSPYVCTERLPGQEEDEKDKGTGESGTEQEDAAAAAAEALKAAEAAAVETAIQASSAEKLAKLEPLPTLLAEFDLDTHVGLIQRLLQIDPNLVEMQSHLSGGGERERTFWRNYFFHCAYARYEAGLSVDEIWCPKPLSSPDELSSRASSTDQAKEGSEGEITFDQQAGKGGNHEGEAAGVAGTVDPTPSSAAAAAAGQEVAAPPASESAPPTPATTSSTTAQPNPPVTSAPKADAEAAGASTPTSAVSGTDYEMISGGGDGVDEELDELEAEIARELED